MNTGISVLIIDDMKINHLILESYIRNAGMPIQEIITASNGQEALDILARKQVTVIFADITMPVMDGLTFMKEMQGRQVSIPVIVVTAEKNDRALDALRLGAKQYITKPYTDKDIAAALRRALA